MMQDQVIIEGLKVQCVIGVFEWEKQIQQTLVFDLSLYCDIRQAAKSDDLVDAINYAAVADTVIAFCKEHQFELIETLAERLCALLLAQFHIAKIDMTLRKPAAVPAANSVGLRIQRVAGECQP